MGCKKMAEFLTTTGISYNLEKLIGNSEEKLFLVSPYLEIAGSLKHLLKERDLQRIVDIHVVYSPSFPLKNQNQHRRAACLQNFRYFLVVAFFI